MAQLTVSKHLRVLREAGALERHLDRKDRPA
jgi:DNA-binding transcriptional ArsR family regulator